MFSVTSSLKSDIEMHLQFYNILHSGFSGGILDKVSAALVK